MMQSEAGTAVSHKKLRILEASYVTLGAGFKVDISGRAEDSSGKAFRWRRNSIRFRMEETHRYRCVVTHD